MRPYIPILIAASFPLLAAAFTWVGSGQSERIFDEPRILAFNMAYIAAPFFLFFVIRRSTRKYTKTYDYASLAGLIFAGIFWIWSGWQGYVYQSSETGGGADIGLGLILLFLPVITFCIILATAIYANKLKSRI